MNNDLPVVTSYTGTEKVTNDFEYALVTTAVAWSSNQNINDALEIFNP